ncbi:MAG: DNA-directed RNA polymerase subunit omega [Actinomycetia bacterium]|nr:DNA-directed RNA polymerase subunit omega [Actinomycetes bacterium]
MSMRPEGVTHPSIDELLTSTESKYSLVIYAARRARQITGYYSQVGEYALEYVGPLVEAHPQEKAMSIALREIHAGLLVASTEDPAEAAARAQAAAAEVAVEDVVDEISGLDETIETTITELPVEDSE